MIGMPYSRAFLALQPVRWYPNGYEHEAIGVPILT